MNYCAEWEKELREASTIVSPQKYIEATLTLAELATPVHINSNFIHELMNRYANYRIDKAKEKQK